MVTDCFGRGVSRGRRDGRDPRLAIPLVLGGNFFPLLPAEPGADFLAVPWLLPPAATIPFVEPPKVGGKVYIRAQWAPE